MIRTSLSGVVFISALYAFPTVRPVTFAPAFLVENGTNRTGLAGRTKGLLEKEGWSSVEVGNGDLTRKSIIMTSNESYGEMIKKTLGVTFMEKLNDPNVIEIMCNSIEMMQFNIL